VTSANGLITALDDAHPRKSQITIIFEKDPMKITTTPHIYSSLLQSLYFKPCCASPQELPPVPLRPSNLLMLLLAPLPHKL